MEKDKALVRILVRARENFQDMRKRMDNRMGRKANGEMQNVSNRIFQDNDYVMISSIADAAKEQEGQVEKHLRKVLKRFPIYTEYLKSIKGVGEISAGWIISEFDIHEATTVSKMWQFAGLNPGMVRGVKRVKAGKYKEKMGEIIKTLEHESRENEYFVLTDKMVRGDKLTEGFVSPFNKRLRVALCGVLATSFVTQQAPYALEYYYPYKERLANSDRLISEISKKGGEPKDVPWNDAKPAHRDRAAQRYMIKMFIKDLYVVWRGMEGLPVRAPYAEEYLGKVHEG